MKFESHTNRLLDDDGALIKQLMCPEELSIHDLEYINGSSDRFCVGCSKQIRCIDGMSESAVRELVDEDADVCIFAMAGEGDIVGVSTPAKDEDGNGELAKLRVIKTARGVDAINEAVSKGYWPLVKKVEQSPEMIHSMEIWQNRVTGEVEENRLFRSDHFDLVLPDFTYYPNPPQHPVAAYLIPEELEQGERVVLEDLIEDIVAVYYAGRGGRGTSRFASCEATWNGSEFELHIPPSQDMIG